MAWIGAVQSPGYAGAKWAVAQRTKPSLTDAAMEQAFTDGTFYAPTYCALPGILSRPPTFDGYLRLLHRTSTPPVPIISERSGLKSPTFRPEARHNRQRVRRRKAPFHSPQLASALEQAGIVAEELRLGYLVIHAELNGILCTAHGAANNSPMRCSKSVCRPHKDARTRRSADQLT